MKKIGLICMLMAVMAACTSPKEKALKEIKGLEQNDSAFSEALMSEIKAKYLAFAASYPDDEASPLFLLKAAQHSIVLNQPQEAIELLGQVIEKYPKTNFAEEALFLQALTYENNMNDLAQAKEKYELFLKSYPKAELANEAKLAIENLGKSPEEIIESRQQID
jgi:TolA-binding protein